MKVVEETVTILVDEIISLDSYLADQVREKLWTQLKSKFTEEEWRNTKVERYELRSYYDPVYFAYRFTLKCEITGAPEREINV